MKQLFDHINNYCTIDKDEFEEIASFFEVKTVEKKEQLYNAGAKGLHHYFVLKGCLHMYFINDRGAEHTLQFAIKNWWLTDYLAFQNNKSSEFYIQAVNPSIVLEISSEKQDALLEQFPKMESYFRQIYQTGYGAAMIRMKYIFGNSKEEIYFRFKDDFPGFVNNVPQYLVATFLGLSPEYVSKLRRKELS